MLHCCTGLTVGDSLNHVRRTSSSAPDSHSETGLAGRLDNHRDAVSKKPTTTVFNDSLTTPTGAATPPRGGTSVGAGTDSWATAEPPTGNDTAVAPGAWIATDADGATRATEPGTAPTAGTATRAADGNAGPDPPAPEPTSERRSGNPADTRAPRAAAGATGRLTLGPIRRATSPDRVTA